MERAPWKPRRPFPKMLYARETSTRALRSVPQALRGRLELRYPQAWPPAEAKATATRASSPRRRRGRSLRPRSERASSTDIFASVPTPFPRRLSVFVDNASVASTTPYNTLPGWKILSIFFPLKQAVGICFRNEWLERGVGTAGTVARRGHSWQDRIEPHCSGQRGRSRCARRAMLFSYSSISLGTRPRKACRGNPLSPSPSPNIKNFMFDLRGIGPDSQGTDSCPPSLVRSIPNGTENGKAAYQAAFLPVSPMKPQPGGGGPFSVPQA